jgi:hypothetical protein
MGCLHNAIVGRRSDADEEGRIRAIADLKPVGTWPCETQYGRGGSLDRILNHAGARAKIDASKRPPRSGRTLNLFAARVNKPTDKTPGALPATYALRRDDRDFVVFCFARPDDAQALAKRFGGKRLPVACKYPENKRGDAKAALDVGGAVRKDSSHVVGAEAS